jgi:fatty acid desaturase
MKSNSAAITEDFQSLKAKCQEVGGTKRPLIDVWMKVLLICLAFVGGSMLRVSAPILAFALASVGGITLVWWIHDAGHDAYFLSKKVSKIGIELMGLLFLGMPQIEYHYEIHRRHHGWTNVIGRDGALETGPIVWDPEMLGPKKTRPLANQNWVWFLIILPLTWPLITLRCLQTLVSRRAYLRLSLFSLRWILVLWIFNFDWVFILGPILVTGFVLGFSATLNHFHMPMSKTTLAPFPKSVFLTTQNIKQRNWFVTWMMGGLNFHVEHHLFPTIPSSRLRKIAPLVEEFARKHGIPYQVCSISEATGRVVHRLKEPLLSSADKEVVL